MKPLTLLLPLAVMGAADAPSYNYQTLASKAVNEYHEKNVTIIQFPLHKATGEYLLYGNKNYKASNIITFDTAGLPMYINAGTPVYNIVTLAQFALSEHGKFTRGTKPLADFIVAADKLVELQRSDGAIPYSYPYGHHAEAEPFKPGWTSGMAQGQAISVFSRAYAITKAGKYLDAGNIALRFMLTDKREGGTSTTLADLDPRLADDIFIEEWVTKTGSYTLNGYMYALLGLYDWCHTTGAKLACNGFDRGVRSLEIVLPRYDVGGFSTYDLTHITDGLPPMLNIYYHAIHIQLLRTLAELTNDETFSTYADRWTSYVAG